MWLYFFDMNVANNRSANTEWKGNVALAVLGAFSLAGMSELMTLIGAAEVFTVGLALLSGVLVLLALVSAIMVFRTSK